MSVAKRHWLRFLARAGRLILQPSSRTDLLVRRSYDSIARDYDRTWTQHMRRETLVMLDQVDWPAGARVVDLACGTGFIAGQMQRRTDGPTTGVDTSAGMIEVARANYPACRFVQSDVLTYLEKLPRCSVDIVTCGWGLGYSRPARLIRQACRVLTPGGYLAVLDNSLFSLAEIFWTSVLCFAETPDALAHAMKVRFLPHVAVLTALMRHAGLAVQWQTAGKKTYHTPTGQAAIERLRATGAAAGFEFAASEGTQEAVYERFAQLLESRYAADGQIPITHRYLGAIGRKPR